MGVGRSFGDRDLLLGDERTRLHRHIRARLPGTDRDPCRGASNKKSNARRWQSGVHARMRWSSLGPIAYGVVDANRSEVPALRADRAEASGERSMTDQRGNFCGPDVDGNIEYCQ